MARIRVYLDVCYDLMIRKTLEARGNFISFDTRDWREHACGCLILAGVYS
jgi:hypothetical protein